MAFLSELKGVAYTLTDPLMRRRVDRTWERDRQRARPHGLGRPLVVSLTSYPPRYATLSHTMKSLLAQSVRPDGLLLWIADEDMAGLPADVLRLEGRGVEIRRCPNVRSYKKFLYAFQAHPDAYVVTVDDDAYYWRTWLEDLTAGLRDDGHVPCFRAHGITCDAAGDALPYNSWRHNVAAGADGRVFPTGLGGVAYVPALMHPDVTEIETAMELAPSADDMWLYFMARRAGLTFRKVGPKVRFRNWNESQTVTLYADNAFSGSENDAQFAALSRRYGRVWLEGEAR